MAADAWLVVAWELALFAGVVGLVFALDDLIVDALWLGGIGRRPVPLKTLGRAAPRLTYAILIPAWHEGNVIGAMLDCLRARWGDGRYRVYVGAYPNDVGTLAVVARIAAASDWIQLVILPHAGPSTKGDCLNHLWSRLDADRASGRFSPDAVIVHDAEDVVAALELGAHDHALAGADYTQLPVAPMVNPAGRWWSGHYVDEFAEAHLKEMAVRDAVGAMLPTAGVGCAIRVGVLDRLGGGGAPFAAGSLTEDYELGIRLAAAGARGRFVLLNDAAGRLIATRAYFPHRFDDAVRQKTRWMHGIALSGWDRLGWTVAPRADAVEVLTSWWMLWRDRRTMLSVLAMAAGYVALMLTLAVALAAPDAVQLASDDPAVRMLATIMTLVLLWRLMMRAIMTARVHGWQQGLVAIPRLFISNIVLVACGWRALRIYVATLRGAPLRWDKTAHHFPLGATLGVTGELARR